MARSDRSQERVVELAQDVVARVQQGSGAQGVTVVHFPDVDDVWTECSEPVADDDVPESVFWSSHWTVTFDPKRATSPLVDELVAAYVPEGWVLGRELHGDGGGRSVPLGQDGYTMRLGGTTAVDPERVAALTVYVTGPCVDAPQDIREWKAGT